MIENRHQESETWQPDTDAPQWFVDNLKQPGISLRVPVNGRQVNLLCWNRERTELPVLLLVHGFGAHVRWWSFLAPFFTDRYRVYALDMPGMGDSEAPLVYDELCFAQGIIGSIEQLDLSPVCIVGHSYGGAQSLRATTMAPHLFSRAIVVDSNVRFPPEPLIRRLQPKGTHKQSATRADCLDRFRIVPSQPNNIDAILQYIGWHSCEQDALGWHWKADPDCINSAEIESSDILEQVECRVDLIYGQKSFLNVRELPQRILQCLPQAGRLIEIPDAGHHIMVDYPLELVAAINELLSA